MRRVGKGNVQLPTFNFQLFKVAGSTLCPRALFGRAETTNGQRQTPNIQRADSDAFLPWPQFSDLEKFSELPNWEQRQNGVALSSDDSSQNLQRRVS